MNLRLSSALAAATSLLVACGGGGSKNNPDANTNSVDAPTTVDATPPVDGSTCTSTVFGAQDVQSATRWGGPVTTDLGDGTSVFGIEFYTGEPNLVTPIDLATGKQNNYATCAECVRVFTNDAQGALVRQYFQSGGTMTLTQDPLTTGNMIGTITNLALVEVTVDSANGFKSTPVVGGKCIAVGNVTLNHTKVPNAWTCAQTAYEDGTSCDCKCGVSDPDCGSNKPIVGCTGTEVCPADTCLAWTCPTAKYHDGTTCDCGCGIPDPDCDIATNPVAGCMTGQVCTNAVCVTPPPPPANDTCQTATALTIGTPVTGTTVSAVNNYNAGLEGAACTGFTQRGGDVAYSVTLAAATAYTFALSNVATAFDPSIALLGPGTAAAVCDANPVVCLKGADTGLAGQGETFTFTPTTAGTYYVIVDSNSSTVTGTFTVTVTSP